jgi:hypothetical protein
MDKFRCKSKTDSWISHIRYLKYYGSHYEMYIESCSGLIVTFDETSSGIFLCVPIFNIDCELVN